MIFDALTFPGKPIIKNFMPLTMVYDQQLGYSDPGIVRMPLQDALDAIKLDAPIMLDIEIGYMQTFQDWRPKIGTKPNQEVLDILLEIIQYLRNRTEQPIGWFGLPYGSTVWSQSWTQLVKRRMQSKHDQLKPLFDAVDFFGYGAYLTTQTLVDWMVQLKGAMIEAQRITNKPVVNFICPNHIGAINEPYFTADEFGWQLSEVMKYGDVVLWNNWHTTTTWDESLPFVIPLRKALNG